MTYDEVVLLVVDFMDKNTLYPTSPMPADDKLIKEIGTYLGFSKGKRIRVVPIDTSNKLILGYLRHYIGNVDIAINDSALNSCWKRFVITKELSHLIMSKNGEGVTSNIEELISNIMQLSFGVTDDIEHENFAIYMAIEYLMPYKISQDMLKDKDLSSLTIATRFGIPEVAVKAWRDKDHLEDRDKAYALANEKHEVISKTT